MTDADRATIDAATRQYQTNADYLNQVIKAGEHNIDNLTARLCRDYRLPPTAIVYLVHHATHMMQTELAQ